MPTTTNKQTQPLFTVDVSLIAYKTNAVHNTTFLPYDLHIPALFSQTLHHILRVSRFALCITETTIGHSGQQHVQHVWAEWGKNSRLTVQKQNAIPRNWTQYTLIHMQSPAQRLAFFHQLLNIHAWQINTMSQNAYMQYHEDKANSFTMPMRLLEYLGLMMRIDVSSLTCLNTKTTLTTLLEAAQAHIALRVVYLTHHQCQLNDTLLAALSDKKPVPPTSQHPMSQQQSHTASPPRHDTNNNQRIKMLTPSKKEKEDNKEKSTPLKNAKITTHFFSTLPKQSEKQPLTFSIHMDRSTLCVYSDHEENDDDEWVDIDTTSTMRQ